MKAVNDNRHDMADPRADLTVKLEQLRAGNTAALATSAANTGRVAKKLDDVTSQSGGDAIAGAGTVSYEFSSN